MEEHKDTFFRDTFFSPEAVSDITYALNAILADGFSLYIKTKNFHWHVSGPHFLSLHRLFDGQAGEILTAMEAMAERVRKIGGHTIRSIGQIARLSQIADNNQDLVAPSSMLEELYADNAALAERMRQTHDLCCEHGDIATAGLLKAWIDAAEGRLWILAETAREPVETT